MGNVRPYLIEYIFFSDRPTTKRDPGGREKKKKFESHYRFDQ